MTHPKRRSFELFDGVYRRSSEFPAQALKEIPPHLVDAIDKGNAEFFADVRASLPNFYDALVHRSGPLHLLETISVSASVTDFGAEHRHYCWGLQCPAGLVTIGIPVIEVAEIAEQLHIPYLASLPTSLHCCYRKMDGMAIPETIGPDGYDLPSSFNDWGFLSDYCEDQGIPRDRTEGLRSAFPGDDLRVYIRGSRTDIILVNFTKKDRRLYHVRDHDFDGYAGIDDVPAVLDDYFANAVLGFPQQVDLRRPTRAR